VNGGTVNIRHLVKLVDTDNAPKHRSNVVVTESQKEYKKRVMLYLSPVILIPLLYFTIPVGDLMLHGFNKMFQRVVSVNGDQNLV
jgi:hypothetical protein